MHLIQLLMFTLIFVKFLAFIVVTKNNIIVFVMWYFTHTIKNWLHLFFHLLDLQL